MNNNYPSSDTYIRLILILVTIFTIVLTLNQALSQPSSTEATTPKTISTEEEIFDMPEIVVHAKRRHP